MAQALRQGRVAALLILAAGLLVFHNTFSNSFHYDDEHSIVDNPHIRSLASIPRLFVDAGTFSGMPEARMYRPLLLVTYALNYAAGGYRVFGYHLVNLGLHLLNACLIWVLARRLLDHPGAALAAGLVFAVHPLAGEPVNYISGRSSLLATLFVLLALWSLVVLVRQQGGRGRLLALGAACTGGLLSKETALALPLLAVLYLGLVARRRAWQALFILALLSGLYLAGTAAIIGRAVRHPPRPHAIHLLTQTKAVAFCLWTAVMPVRLSVEPAFRVVRHAGEPAVVAAGLLLASMGFVLWQGRRSFGVLSFAALWFPLGLLPALVVPLHVLINAQRIYLSLAGLALVAGWLWRMAQGYRRVAGGLLVLCLAVLCVQRNPVWRSEESLWADAAARGPGMPRAHLNLGKALLEQGRLEESVEASLRALSLDPDLALAHYNLGTAYLGLGKAESAIAYYRRALELRPDLVQAHNNLGNAYLHEGQGRQAVAAYRRALELQPHPSLHHNLGSAFLSLGQPDSAGACFRRALALDPGLRAAHEGLIRALLQAEQLTAASSAVEAALERWPGDSDLLRLGGDAAARLGREEAALQAYLGAGLDSVEVWVELARHARVRGDLAAARRHCEQALMAGPLDARGHEALGAVLGAQGDVGAGLEAFRQATRLAPQRSAPYAGIGRVFLGHGKGAEAVAALQRAADLAPADGEVQGMLGQALWEAGRIEEAVAAYRRSLRLAPGRAQVYHNLGFILAQQGRAVEAEGAYREALIRDPGLTEAHYNLGFLWLEQGRFGEAAEAFEIVVARQPERAGAHLNLASARAGLGDAEGAATSLQAFLNLAPTGDPLRPRAAARLQEMRRQLGPGR